MFYKIIETIHNQLMNDVGTNSAYSSDKIEYIAKNMPDTITVNRMLCLIRRSKEKLDYVIGQSPAFTFEYFIDIVVVTKHMSFDEGEKSLETIERRIIKSMSDRTKSIFSLSDTRDSITEQVLKVQLERVDYDSGLLEDNDWAHVSVMSYKVTTQFQV